MVELYIEGVRQSSFRIEIDGTCEPDDSIAGHPRINEFYDGNAAWIEFSDNTVHPLSSGASTTWHYDGEITSFEVDGAINVEANGTEVTPGQLVSHYEHYPMDRLVVWADDGSDVSYNVTVDGSLEAGSGFEGSMSGSSANDDVPEDGWSDFYYDGTITKFEVSTNNVSCYDNCEAVDPGEIATPPHEPPTAAYNTTKNYLEVTFDASPSSPGTDPIDSFEWIIDNRVYRNEVVTHTFGSAGTYDVSLEVFDTTGASDVKRGTVTVDAQENPPTADFSYSVDGLTVSLNGGSSSAGTNPIVEYSWDIDGTPRSGQTTTHTFESGGVKSVSLTVTDSEGLDDTTSTSIEVEEKEGGGGVGAAPVLALGLLGAVALSEDDNPLGAIREALAELDDELAAKIESEAEDDDEE